MSVEAHFSKDPKTVLFMAGMFNTHRAGFLSLDTFDGSSHQYIGAAVNTFLRHQLLDQLLDSVDFPANANRRDFPSIDISPEVSTTLQRVSDSFPTGLLHSH